MDLLERAEFLDELQSVLTGAAAGRGRTVLVSGEAGIGKTSLIEAFAAVIRQRAGCSGAHATRSSRRVLLVRCTILRSRCEASSSSISRPEGRAPQIFSSALDVFTASARTNR